jgi:hypothetical protein
MLIEPGVEVNAIVNKPAAKAYCRKAKAPKEGGAHSKVRSRLMERQTSNRR